MATYKISPETAARTVSLISYHKGDLGAAIHDTRIGLQSLAEYTDRKAEAVLDLLKWLQVRDTKFPDSIQARRDQLARIAEQTTKAVRISLKCNECGKTWRVSPNADPQCPKCNGVDYDVV